MRVHSQPRCCQDQDLVGARTRHRACEKTFLGKVLGTFIAIKLLTERLVYTFELKQATGYSSTVTEN